MSYRTEDIFVVAGGLFTSLCAATAILTIGYHTGFDFFTLMVWFIVPLGAIGTGCVAASGFYFGSIFFNHRPTTSILLKMVCVAAFTQFFIYYGDYILTSFDDGTPIRGEISFFDYIQFMLTASVYSISRSTEFELGYFGYLIAFIQFIGLMAGGLGVYGLLHAKPYCDRCILYLQKSETYKHLFRDSDAFMPYLEKIRKDRPLSDYRTLLNEEHHIKWPKKGAVRFASTFYSCKGCRKHVIHEDIFYYEKRNWVQDEELSRSFTVEKA